MKVEAEFFSEQIAMIIKDVTPLDLGFSFPDQRENDEDHEI